jgi:hypothetical protein
VWSAATHEQNQEQWRQGRQAGRQSRTHTVCALLTHAQADGPERPSREGRGRTSAWPPPRCGSRSPSAARRLTRNESQAKNGQCRRPSSEANTPADAPTRALPQSQTRADAHVHIQRTWDTHLRRTHDPTKAPTTRSHAPLHTSRTHPTWTARRADRMPSTAVCVGRLRTSTAPLG